MTLIKDLPLDDRPREKMLLKGINSLSDADLLAILIRTGTKDKSAIKIAQELVQGNNNLAQLARSDLQDLSTIKGIGKVKAITILAALELGKRVAIADSLQVKYFKNSKEMADYLMPRLRYKTRECLLVVLLNIKCKIIEIVQITEGTSEYALANARTVFSLAVKKDAHAIILCHNHPSGDIQPSVADTQLTKQLVASGVIIGIIVLDHIIIGAGKYFSFQEHNMI